MDIFKGISSTKKEEAKAAMPQTSKVEEKSAFNFMGGVSNIPQNEDTPSIPIYGEPNTGVTSKPVEEQQSAFGMLFSGLAASLGSQPNSSEKEKTHEVQQEHSKEIP